MKVTRIVPMLSAATWLAGAGATSVLGQDLKPVRPAQVEIRQPERPERPERRDRPDRPERRDRRERPDRPEHRERPSRPDVATRR